MEQGCSPHDVFGTQKKGKSQGSQYPTREHALKTYLSYAGSKLLKVYHFQIVWQADTQALHVWGFEEHSILKPQQKD